MVSQGEAVFTAGTIDDGLYLLYRGMVRVDEEGELQTVDVNAKFLNGKPQGIEATYVMKTTADWNRFMRFMERYAEDNGLGFSAKK